MDDSSKVSEAKTVSKKECERYAKKPRVPICRDPSKEQVELYSKDQNIQTPTLAASPYAIDINCDENAKEGSIKPAEKKDLFKIKDTFIDHLFFSK